MPHIVKLPRVRSTVCRIVALTAMGVLGSTGMALAACPTQATTTVFSKFGDTGQYFPAPGGSFEASSLPSGFVVKGASLTAGNEPWYVNSTTDKKSLQINGGGSVTTPYICIDSTMPYFRFFAHQLATGSDLKVDLLVNMNGSIQTHSVTDLANGSMPAWNLTGKLAVANLAVPSGMTVHAALRVYAPTSSGSWQIDDVYIDPYAR
jgi:hypothetical protein